MRYGLAEGSLKVRRRIWALYHPSDLVKEEDTNDPGIMGLNALTAEGDWSEDYVVNGQSYVSSDELFFAAPDYEEIRLCEDTGVHEYWESGLTIESLDALRLGRGDYASSTCYYCKNRGHLKANCPDRRLADRKPWE